jgi:hypothetical protein
MLTSTRVDAIGLTNEVDFALVFGDRWMIGSIR